MKPLTFFSFALLLAACGNHQTPPTTESSTPVATETTTPVGNEGLGVAITVFAQWKQGTQATVDGEYDAKEAMFIPCGSNQGMTINRGDVRIISGGSCGGGITGKMEPDMRIIKRTGTTFTVVSRDVALKEVTNEKGKVQYQTTAGAKQIVVDPETMNRLRAEKTIMQRVPRN